MNINLFKFSNMYDDGGTDDGNLYLRSLKLSATMTTQQDSIKERGLLTISKDCDMSICIFARNLPQSSRAAFFNGDDQK
jgi:hypothetical protein